MAGDHTSRANTGSNKVLWVGVAMVVVLVLVMGVELLRSQAELQEPHRVALPVKPEPITGTSATDISAVTQAASSTQPVPSAAGKTDHPAVTDLPRRVQPSVSEPAVARTPAPVAPKP